MRNYLRLSLLPQFPNGILKNLKDNRTFVLPEETGAGF